MENNLLKSLLSRLDKYAFEDFCFKMLKEEYDRNLKRLDDIDESIFEMYEPRSLGDPTVFTFITNFFPIELFKEHKQLDIANYELKEKIKNVAVRYKSNPPKEWWTLPIEYGSHTMFILNNFSNLEKEFIEEKLFPEYEKLIHENGLKLPVGLGNYDTFLDNDKFDMKSFFEKFIMDNDAGITIQLSSSNVSVRKFQVEKQYFSGVLKNGLNPLEPCYCTNPNKILIELENLIKNNVSEATLEDYLRTYYREIFGYKYDRIETQVWLKFPDIDLGNKNRRLDLFLRNSIENDWELFELKKPITLTKTSRDIVVFKDEVNQAIQQIKNYQRLLSQDIVKKKLAQEGIEYYEPSLNLIIGRKPQIDPAQWRWIKNSNENNLKIITYDDLLKEATIRLSERNIIFRENITL